VDGDGRLANPLLSEVLLLSIKLRLDESLGSTPLAGVDCDLHPVLYQYLPPNPTVADFLRLSNIALGSFIGPPHLPHLLAALRCINGRYGLCGSADAGRSGPGTAFSPGFAAASDEEPRSWAVFPNPTAGEVSLRLGHWEGQAVLIRLFNAQGQAVFSQQLRAAVTTPVALGLPPGLYLLRIDIEHGPVLADRLVIVPRQ
jgi:hypothetical protein